MPHLAEVIQRITELESWFEAVVDVPSLFRRRVAFFFEQLRYFSGWFFDDQIEIA